VTKVGKSNHSRGLGVYDKYIIVYKNLNYDKPHKMINLNFETKFESIREPPTLKPSVTGKNPKPDNYKPEDIVAMGKIIAIKFSYENSEKIWEIKIQGN